MIHRVSRLRALPAAAVVGVVVAMAVLLSGCNSAAEPTSGPDLSAMQTGLQDGSAFSDVRSVTAEYWENNLGHGTLKVTLTVGQGGDAETIADKAVGQIWTKWMTDRVRVIDVVVLGTEDVSYTVQRRYNLPGQKEELTQHYGQPASRG
ncbi:MAG TPA: hypothetical protein VKE25_12035 [Actinomycetes bacterium]|nr:hypothetical protein [Actinomycetes bacterium]